MQRCRNPTHNYWAAVEANFHKETGTCTDLNLLCVVQQYTIHYHTQMKVSRRLNTVL